LGVKPMPSQNASTAVGQPGGRDQRDDRITDEIDIGIGAAGFGRQRVCAEQGRDDVDRTLHAELACGAQLLAFIGEIEPVARFDLDGGDALGEQRIEPRQGLRHQFGLGRGARRRDGRDDAAAGAGDVLITRTRQPQFEFMRAVAAMHQMRVAVDQPRRDPAAVAVMDIERVEPRRCIGNATCIDNAAIKAGDQRVTHRRRAGARQQAGLGPDAVDEHGGT
jgi:hypothetical protein